MDGNNNAFSERDIMEGNHQIYQPINATNSTTDGAGIEAIAARIHERAVQLADEQELLRQETEELQILKENVEKEKERYQTVRLEYLQSETKQNTMEMECMQIQESIKDRTKKTETINAKEMDLRAEMAKSNSEWNKTEAILTRHKLRQEMYLKVLQDVVHQREATIKCRQERIQTAIRLSDDIKKKRDNTVQHQKQLQASIDKMIQMEKEENTFIESLASQVRDCLSKRSELRSILRETQQKSQNVRAEVDQLSNEYRNNNFA